jgi:hypothetical protein
MATLQAAEKKAAEARARICDIALLFKEEQASTAALEAEAEAAAAALQLAPTTASSSSTPTSPPSRVAAALPFFRVTDLHRPCSSYGR